MYELKNFLPYISDDLRLYSKNDMSSSMHKRALTGYVFASKSMPYHVPAGGAKSPQVLSFCSCPWTLTAIIGSSASFMAQNFMVEIIIRRNTLQLVVLAPVTYLVIL